MGVNKRRSGRAVPVTQRGQIIVARQNTPVEGAIVSTSAGSRTSTDDGGLYSIQVPKGVAYSMTVEKQGFWKLVEQEWIIDQDTDRKDTSFLSEILASLLAASIPDLDATKGVLTLRVYPTEGCPSVEGATVSIEPAGGKLVYPRGGLPSKETTIAAEESPSAIFYNLPTGVPLQLKASHPTCTFVPYPAKADGFTVETYQFPTIVDDRQRGSRFWQATLGALDVTADREVVMLYTSLLGNPKIQALESNEHLKQLVQQQAH